MDEHVSTDDGDRPPERSILDPREARSEHRLRRGESAGLLFLQALSTQERQWMERMVAGIARAYRVDRDDLLQELQLSLFNCHSLDRGRQSVRAWITQRARWRAQDMLRASSGEKSIPASDRPLPEAPAPAPTEPDRNWSIERIQKLGLNRDEAQVVLLVLWGVDVSLREFAQLAERNYPKTRQDKIRGLNKIRELFHLDPDENAALVAYRESGTLEAAAVRLNIPKNELRVLVRQAQKKIDRALDRKNMPTIRRHEDESDAG